MEGKLFTPQLMQSQKYGEKLTNLLYKLAYSSREELRNELKAPISLGNIPYVLRAVGISAGEVKLLPNNIPHMIGYGQEKTTVNYKNMHDLNIEEMLAIPSIISNPDMIFRSNTQPNNSIILCKELKNRGNPIILAMKIKLLNSLISSGIIVSGYEKDNSPKNFFSNLYRNGYCIYDSEESEYFNGIKFGAGARDHKVGPIPTYAVACTAPCDKALPTEGISPSVTYKILTKSAIVKKYKENSKELVCIIHNSKHDRDLINRNLSELGYHTISPNSMLDFAEISSIAQSCTAIACGKESMPFVKRLVEKLPNIKRIGEFPSYMPEPIFSNKLLPLSKVTNLITDSSHEIKDKEVIYFVGNIVVQQVGSWC